MMQIKDGREYFSCRCLSCAEVWRIDGEKMMKTGKRMLLLAVWIAGLIGTCFMMHEAAACTRVLYVGDGNMVATGRNMDWNEDLMSNLWVFPRGSCATDWRGPIRLIGNRVMAA